MTRLLRKTLTLRLSVSDIVAVSAESRDVMSPRKVTKTSRSYKVTMFKYIYTCIYMCCALKVFSMMLLCQKMPQKCGIKNHASSIIATCIWLDRQSFGNLKQNSTCTCTLIYRYGHWTLTL